MRKRNGRKTKRVKGGLFGCTGDSCATGAVVPGERPMPPPAPTSASVATPVPTTAAAAPTSSVALNERASLPSSMILSSGKYTSQSGVDINYEIEQAREDVIVWFLGGAFSKGIRNAKLRSSYGDKGVAFYISKAEYDNFIENSLINNGVVTNWNVVNKNGETKILPGTWTVTTSKPYNEEIAARETARETARVTAQLANFRGKREAENALLAEKASKISKDTIYTLERGGTFHFDSIPVFKNVEIEEDHRGRFVSRILSRYLQSEPLNITKTVNGTDTIIPNAIIEINTNAFNAFILIVPEEYGRELSSGYLQVREGFSIPPRDNVKGGKHRKRTHKKSKKSKRKSHRRRG